MKRGIGIALALILGYAVMLAALAERITIHDPNPGITLEQQIQAVEAAGELYGWVN